MNVGQRPPTPADAVILANQNQSLQQENQLRAYNEQVYYNNWQEEIRKRTNLEAIIVELRQQLAELKDKIQNNENQEQKEEQPVTYSTDEEEFIKDPNEFTEVRSRRNKRKASESPQKTTEIKKTSNFQKDDKKHIDKLPPIMVKEVKDYDKLYTEITQLSIACKVTALMNGMIKINVESVESYKKLEAYLDDKKFSWYTYECKQDRPIKVMAKRLPATTKPEKIITELHSKGFRTVDAVNIISKRRIVNSSNETVIKKEPIPMFMLTFSKDEDIKKIYAIKQIQGASVIIEPVRKSKLIPQCKRCQLFGHTQGFCRMNPQCVKCGGNHETRDCRKPAATKPKCANCQLEHPANYRGCEVAKDAQKRRQQAVTAKRTQQPVARPAAPTALRKEGVTYAQIFKKTPRSDNTQQEADTNKTTNDILTNILAQLEKQGKIIEALSDRVTKLEWNYTGAPGPSRRH